MERITRRELSELPVLAVLFKDEDGEKRWAYYPVECENILLKSWTENMGDHKVRKVGSTYFRVGEIVMMEKVSFGTLWEREDFKNSAWGYIVEWHVDIVYEIIKNAYEGILGKEIYSLPYRVGEEGDGKE